MWHMAGDGHMDIDVGGYVNPPLHHGIVTAGMDIIDARGHKYDV
jgi:hypothetical protein